MLVIWLTIAVALFVASFYVVYELFFHPLSSFPGPFWASLTDFWRFYHEIKGDTPHEFLRYHQKYGPIIRTAPNELDFSTADVVEVVYKKGGRAYPKSRFYDGFTAIKPNVFGTRDEDLHAVRRRQMAHGFSQASFTRMEYIFDKHVGNLIRKLTTYANGNNTCDLKILFKCYGHDVNCDLSLGRDFQTLEAKDLYQAIPPLNDHIVLSKLTGYVPWLKPYFAKYGKSVPWPYLQKLLRSRTMLAMQAEEATTVEFEKLREKREKIRGSITQDDEVGHVNLLSALVQAKDPETGALLAQDEVSSNALAFLVAGSHSTAASLAFLFWHLLHNPKILRKVVGEINNAYADLEGDCIAPYAGMEAKLPYVSAVIKESFRLTPPVQHPLPRITPSDPENPRFPTIIANKTIPPGTAVSASILALHLNPDIWGSDAEKFIPERWFAEDIRQREKYLMHFGAGHRMCIGKNQALIILWKATVEMLRSFEFSLSEEQSVNEKIVVIARGFAELGNELEVMVTSKNIESKTQ